MGGAWERERGKRGQTRLERVGGRAGTRRNSLKADLEAEDADLLASLEAEGAAVAAHLE